MNGGAEAQQPLGIIADSRLKELPEIDVVELVVCNYCGVEQAFWKPKYKDKWPLARRGSNQPFRQQQTQGVGQGEPEEQY